MLPICEICAKTGVLCNSCETKLKNNEISDLDVKISKIIYRLGKDIGFKRAIDTDDFVIILTNKRDIGKIFGVGGENIKVLESELGKPIRVVSAESTEELVYSFVSPANIISVSRLFKTDGSVVKRVTINKKDMNKLRMDISDIKKIVSTLTNEKIEIVTN